MKGAENNPNKKKLRKQAEKKLSNRSKRPEDVSRMTPEAIRSLVQELTVHQIELEMQNEELRQAQLGLEEVRDRYAHLYDFAPIGYLTISEGGIILEANLTIAAMLGAERSLIVNRPFSGFITEDSQDIFYLHRNKAMETETRQTFEMKLQRADGTQFYAQVEGLAVADAEERSRELRVAVLDVTERKEAEQALEERERLYRDLYENAPNAYYTVRAVDGSISDCNKAALTLMGYDKKTLMGMKVFDLYANTPGGKPKAHRVFKRFMTGEPLRDIELQMKRRNGDPIWISLSVEPVKDDAGSVVESRSAVIDISERKRAEEDLREREATLDSIFRAAPIGIGLVSDRIVKKANDRLCKMTGYSREDLLEKNARILYPSDDEYEYVGREKYEQINEWGIGIVETQWKRKDGRLIDVLLSSTPLDAADISAGKTFTALDITDRKQMEDALRKSYDELEDRVEERTAQLNESNKKLRGEIEERRKAQELLKKSEAKYRTLFDESRDVVFITTRDGRFVDINQSGIDLFGYTRKELDKLDVQDLYADPGNREAFKEEIEKRGFVRDYEAAARTKDGAEIDCLVTSSLRRDEDGQIIGYQGILRDVTEQKRSQEQIGALTAELVKAQEVERQRISHELHDHIGQELSALRIGISGFSSDFPEAPAGAANSVSEWSLKLQDIIKALRDLAHDLRPTGLDHLGLVLTARHYCQEFSDRHGLRVDFFSAGIDERDIDFDMQINLYRLIQESLNNVRKHAHATRASVRLLGSFPNIVLRIEDDGKGFDVQSELTSSADKKRMGLSFMNERVSLLRGQMEIESHPQGTTIFVTVPAKGGSHGS